MNSPRYTDSNTSVDEGLEDYKPDGYHPVHIGEILLERYVIMQKLGYGHFSTAWLALDSKYGNYVCIKIQKNRKQKGVNAWTAARLRPGQNGRR